ncbi:SGNH/GDSL hydrolase family protein [Pseudomonas costantinii]|uniref:Phospholipase/lecithinase/hemolysin n=1 Tax=Pseudomonas costantinii TaxID=168469 RepID=A0A1H4ZHY0_9PSED|nr:SGNH/GDSL hydrolase family protein [Pseudomonas costantinii]NVZ22739.1 SGNH/GDSL hydrolase family protein [Pseudomonas costantinii]SED29587.1 Phospholipase/lecithinase/hemolysin [Pseudomonas costantinii]
MIRRACLAAFLTLSASAALGASHYDHLYAFGDSYSDNGAGEAFTSKLVVQQVKDAQELPGALYWKGRWSNGPTAVEGLAQALKTPLTDYAVGGAKSGHGNYYAWMMPSRDTGVLGQIADHLQAAKSHKADPKALYFIFISANDFFEWADFTRPETIEALSESSLANIRSATEQLIAAGAKRVMVVGTTDLSHVPAVVQGNQVDNAKNYQQLLEQKLPAALASLALSGSAKVTYFDHLAFSDKLRAEPAANGFKDLNTPCQATYPEVKPVCADPDAHYYWDEWHPTRKVHALVAKAMLQTLNANP